MVLLIVPKTLLAESNLLHLESLGFVLGIDGLGSCGDVSAKLSKLADDHGLGLQKLLGPVGWVIEGFLVVFHQLLFDGAAAANHLQTWVSGQRLALVQYHSSSVVDGWRLELNRASR